MDFAQAPLAPNVLSWAQNNGLHDGNDFTLGDYGTGNVIGNSTLGRRSWEGGQEAPGDFVSRLYGAANAPGWGTAGRSVSDLQNDGFFNTTNPFERNGTQYKRVGSDPNSDVSGMFPSVQNLFKSQGVGQRVINDQEFGFGVPMDDYMQLNAAQEKANKGGMLKNPLALMAIMATMAAGGGALAGMGAGGAGAAGAAGAGLSAEGAGGIFSGLYGDALAGTGAFEGLAGAGAAGAGAAGAGAIDPIQGIMMLDEMGGGVGATAGATSMGYPSVEAAMADIGSWGGAATGAGGVAAGAEGFGAGTGGMETGGTPDASFRGMADKLGSGVNFNDMARLGLSNFGDLGNLMSRLAFTNVGPSIGGIGMSPLSIGQGIYGMIASNKQKKLSEQLGRMADPQSPYRAGYAAQLKGLMDNPSSITSMPGYQAGLEAVERRLAAQGYQGSGNMMAGLQKYGGDFFNNQVAQLNGLAGGNPGNAAQIQLEGNNNSLQLLGQSLNRLAYGITR